MHNAWRGSINIRSCREILVESGRLCFALTTSCSRKRNGYQTTDFLVTWISPTCGQTLDNDAPIRGGESIKSIFSIQRPVETVLLSLVGVSSVLGFASTTIILKVIIRVLGWHAIYLILTKFPESPLNCWLLNWNNDLVLIVQLMETYWRSWIDYSVLSRDRVPLAPDVMGNK